MCLVPANFRQLAVHTSSHSLDKELVHPEWEPGGRQSMNHRSAFETKRSIMQPGADVDCHRLCDPQIRGSSLLSLQELTRWRRHEVWKKTSRSASDMPHDGNPGELSGPSWKDKLDA